MPWNAPLAVASAVFVLFLLWKLRPSVGGSGRGSTRAAALREAKARVSAAKTDEERALALCDAGDALAGRLAGSESAIGYYLRAMRASPRDAALVTRAAKGLARRPRALESLLWRRLGAEPWTGGGEAAAKVALEELARLYGGPLRNAGRAGAMQHARALLGGSSPSLPPPPKA
jgi:hypothetical protein